MTREVIKRIKKFFRTRQEKSITEIKMAFGIGIPMPGKKYECNLIRRVSGHEIDYEKVNVGMVQEITILGKNMLLVSTRKEKYIVDILGKNAKYHFAVIWNEPEIGSMFKHCQIDFKDDKIKVDTGKPAMVFNVVKHCNLYEVQTEDSIYICLMM